MFASAAAVFVENLLAHREWMGGSPEETNQMYQNMQLQTTLTCLLIKIIKRLPSFSLDPVLMVETPFTIRCRPCRASRAIPLEFRRCLPCLCDVYVSTDHVRDRWRQAMPAYDLSTSCAMSKHVKPLPQCPVDHLEYYRQPHIVKSAFPTFLSSLPP